MSLYFDLIGLAKYQSWINPLIDSLLAYIHCWHSNNFFFPPYNSAVTVLSSDYFKPFPFSWNFHPCYFPHCPWCQQFTLPSLSEGNSVPSGDISSISKSPNIPSLFTHLHPLFWQERRWSSSL